MIIERASKSVVGDIGFIGPPAADGTVEIGYSVIPACRSRGYATGSSLRVLVDWALAQPGVSRSFPVATTGMCPRFAYSSASASSALRDGRPFGWRLDGPIALGLTPTSVAGTVNRLCDEVLDPRRPGLGTRRRTETATVAPPSVTTPDSALERQRDLTDVVQVDDCGSAHPEEARRRGRASSASRPRAAARS